MAYCLKCNGRGQFGKAPTGSCPNCKGKGHTYQPTSGFREVGPDLFEMGPRFAGENKVYLFTAVQRDQYRNSPDHGKLAIIKGKKSRGEWRKV